MRQSRFADEQMVAIVREADREPVADVAKRHGVSEQTIYVWRKRFGTLAASEVRRLKALEAENARLFNPIGIEPPARADQLVTESPTSRELRRACPRPRAPPFAPS